eukprot:scaffold1_cov402-Prasinococcus_capsulatus_cf.AAC.58
MSDACLPGTGAPAIPRQSTPDSSIRISTHLPISPRGESDQAGSPTRSQAGAARGARSEAGAELGAARVLAPCGVRRAHAYIAAEPELVEPQTQAAGSTAVPRDRPTSPSTGAFSGDPHLPASCAMQSGPEALQSTPRVSHGPLPFDGSLTTVRVFRALAAAFQISQLLGTGLNKETLALLIGLCEVGTKRWVLLVGECGSTLWLSCSRTASTQRPSLPLSRSFVARAKPSKPAQGLVLSRCGLGCPHLPGQCVPVREIRGRAGSVS